MTLRTVGLLFFSVGIVAGGWLIGERIKRQQKDLSFLLHLTEHLYSEIRYTRAELPDCFLSYKEPGERHITGKMSKGAYGEAFDALCLPKELKKEMCIRFSKLGSGTIDEELLKIERIRNDLQNENDKAAKTAGGSVRSARVLGVCIAAAVLLLFL